MNADTTQPFKKLVTLLTYVRRGAFVVALYDRLPIRHEMTAALCHRLPQRVYVVYLSSQQRNPIDLIRALKPKMGDVVCLFDLEHAFPEALSYLDLQREVLADMDISVICWVRPFEHRELARRAPNFYAFRRSIFDFTSVGELPPAERHFIGRKREVRELTRLLRAGGCVVLTGLGGVGKTALAKRWRTRCAPASSAGRCGWSARPGRPLATSSLPLPLPSSATWCDSAAPMSSGNG